MEAAPFTFQSTNDGTSCTYDDEMIAALSSNTDACTETDVLDCPDNVYVGMQNVDRKLLRAEIVASEHYQIIF